MALTWRRIWWQWQGRRTIRAAERRRVRWIAALNRKAGVCIDPSCRISPTAIIETEAGGTIRLGPRVEVREGAILQSYGGSIEIAADAFVGPYCVLYGHGGLRIGAGTMIAAQTVVIPANHRFADPDRPIRAQGLESRGIVIGAEAWVASGVKVLDGAEVGDGAVIGAGAVVTRSVPAGAIAAGVPARIIGWRGGRMRLVGPTPARGVA
jgi:acetyltransferase-like isoleucine patch superfamily enzyme